jgi:hypothetical protein
VQRDLRGEVVGVLGIHPTPACSSTEKARLSTASE